MQEISRKQVQRLIHRGNACLLEVLPQSSYSNAHLPGALNVPFDENFDLHVQFKVPDKNIPVIVYCDDTECDLSPKAAKHLEFLGYTKVFDYAAGKADWRHAGLQMERGSPDELR